VREEPGVTYPPRADRRPALATGPASSAACPLTAHRARAQPRLEGPSQGDRRPPCSGAHLDRQRAEGREFPAVDRDHWSTAITGHTRRRSGLASMPSTNDRPTAPDGERAPATACTPTGWAPRVSFTRHQADAESQQRHDPLTTNVLAAATPIVRNGASRRVTHCESADPQT